LPLKTTPRKVAPKPPPSLDAQKIEAPGARAPRLKNTKNYENCVFDSLASPRIRKKNPLFLHTILISKKQRKKYEEKVHTSTKEGRSTEKIIKSNEKKIQIMPT